MKHVVGISLGSSSRNHSVNVTLLGQECRVERIGTDGDMAKMIRMIKELDGQVDAFGLGGISLNLYTIDRCYQLRDARRIMQAAQKTPIVDGAGIKKTLERRVIRYLAAHTDLLGESKKVLLLCVLDRLGMAQALQEAGCQMFYGDFPFVLGVPILLTSLKTVSFFARMLLPLISRLPFSVIYPAGEKQEINKPRFQRYFDAADIIAGDFPLIYKFMPLDLSGKTIITNTITPENIALLKERNLETLVTTTPDMNGRSFGTNVIEALLVCLSGKNRELTEEEYNQLLDKLNFPVRIVHPRDWPGQGKVAAGDEPVING
ncbi:MAG TPA: quinate 5-dehydrogenase [Bacillota bacterium]|nr:quinate 5-dehydrogenase [Bacillota bacterium]